jgi:hypothetical protein
VRAGFGRHIHHVGLAVRVKVCEGRSGGHG